MIGKNMLSSFRKDQQPQNPVPAPANNEPEPTPDPDATPEPEPTPEPELSPDSTPDPSPEPEPGSDPEPEPSQETEPEPDTKPLELDDDAVLEYFKNKKGKELSSVDDLFKEPEPAVDPYDGLSEEAAQFIKYNKETGRGFEEFKTLNRDFSQASPIDIAREKAIAMSDGYLDSSNVDEYLQEDLNVDLSDINDLSPVEKMKLKNYSSDYVNSQTELKEKYKKPIERPGQEEMVTLENGQRMEKKTYDKLVDQQQKYQNSIKEASDNIKSSAFDIKVDENGTDKVISVAYDYSKDEVRDMASSALNIDSFYQKAFGGDKGLDYGKLQEGLHWADPAKREKSITAIVHKALAKQAEDFVALEHNAGVKTKSMPGTDSTASKKPITHWRGKTNKGIGFTPDQF